MKIECYDNIKCGDVSKSTINLSIPTWEDIYWKSSESKRPLCSQIWGVFFPCVLQSVYAVCSQVWLFVISQTAAHQATLSMEFSRKEYWSGLPFPNPLLSRGLHLLLFPVSLLSHIWIFASPRTVAHQAPLFMGFPREKYWSELPFPSPGDLPDPGINCLLHSQADSLPAEPPGKPLYLLTLGHFTEPSPDE